MLYTKPYFQPSDMTEVFDLVDRAVLGTLLTSHEDGIAISHPVFMIDRTRGANGTLVSHVASANNHADFLRRGLPSIAILMDAGHYVSSSWYPGYPHRDSAPTWSFMVAHIHGVPNILSEAATAKHLHELVKHMEKERDKPWQMKELGPGGLERRLPNIVGYEMPVENMEIKFKLGQDERSTDMKAAISKLRDEGRYELAEMMARHCKI